VLRILEHNTVAPKKLAGLFDSYMHLATLDVDAFVKELGAREMSLEQYAEQIDHLQSTAAAIRATCTNDVRTGE
jgi:hypothetical protein